MEFLFDIFGTKVRKDVKGLSFIFSRLKGPTESHDTTRYVIRDGVIKKGTYNPLPELSFMNPFPNETVSRL